MAKTYDTYKDSSIAWIGNIPSEWEIKKLGNFYTQRNEKVSDKDFPHYLSQCKVYYLSWKLQPKQMMVTTVNL